MENSRQPPDRMTMRENFLVSLLNRVIREYRALLASSKSGKPFRIVEISHISVIPGETRFVVQLANKNCILQVSAADIISRGYDLSSFNDFHAEMIRHAVQGRLAVFLKLSDTPPSFRIVSKRFDPEMQQYILIIETKDGTRFSRTPAQLSADREVLSHMEYMDVYDIGFTQGGESIIREQVLLLAEIKQAI